jgi:hypothetical protein
MIRVIAFKMMSWDDNAPIEPTTQDYIDRLLTREQAADLAVMVNFAFAHVAQLTDGKIWIPYMATAPNAESPQSLAGWVEELQNAMALPVMYKEDFDKMLEKLPIATYPGVRSVVVPEYNMPGGRSRFFRYIWNIGTGG